jgi:FAD/FMN-containing dehydrogenase
MADLGRRRWLRGAALLPLLAPVGACVQPAARAMFRRARPSDASWPSPTKWRSLSDAVGGRLIEVRSPFDVCRSFDDASCRALFAALRNPYFIGDDVALTQTLGWAEAWTSEPSVYAVAASTTEDVVAGINFARKHRLRLVVKGGGHSYQGTSCAADSLLIWTRAMDGVTLHDTFAPAGCRDVFPAVSVGAGAVWMHVYDAVTTKGGRYVQGGGCATVGVAGLVQSGGFGSFSKRYGLAAAGLLEAEVVTADGVVRTANACTNPDLFWALKGGGGGTFGVVTRLTLRTPELPPFFGAVFATVKARSDAAFHRLIGAFAAFYREALLNEHWGETVVVHPGNVLKISMVFAALDRERALTVWKPLFDEVAASSDLTMPAPVIIDLPAREFWNAETLRRIAGAVIADDRSGAPRNNVYWSADRDQAGQFLHGYESIWLPESLLDDIERKRFAEALFRGSRHWPISLHFNKGLAGAPASEVHAARLSTRRH